MSDAAPTTRSVGLLRSSLVVGVMTLLSRILGLVRDVVIAAFVGANANADAFFVAFKIPNFLRRLFAEGAFSQAFVPVLSEYHSLRSFAEVKALVDRVAGVLGATVLVVSGIAMVGAPVVTAVFAPGFIDQGHKFEMAADMIRITFPYLFFISLTGFAGAVLNNYGRFAIPAFTPVWLNVCMILAGLYGGHFFNEPVFALAWAVFVAGAIQFLFQLPFLARLRLLPKPVFDTQDEGVRRILKLMVPALFGVSVSQINLLLDTILASFLPNGSVSWLFYSDRLAELPLGVFAIAISTVILPSLSRRHAESSPEAFNATLNWAVMMVLLISLPSTAALVVLAEPILLTLFQRGAMTVHDATMSSYSLIALSLGLTAFMLIKVLAPGFYARQDTKTPVKIGIIAMVANMGFNLILVLPLHHYWQIGHAGLAAATALSAFLNAWLLFWGLHKARVFLVERQLVLFVGRYLVAIAVMVALLLWLSPATSVWQGWDTWRRIERLTLVCVVGLGGYALVLVALGVRLRHFRGLAT